MSKQTVTHAHPSGSFWARNRKSGGYLLRKTVRRKGYQLIRFLLLFGLCFMIIQPLLDKLSVSFMAERDLYDSTVISIPRHLTTANYSLAASKILLNYGTTFLNTLIVSLAVSVLQIAACTLVGYGFARFEFPFKKFWFAAVIITVIIPPHEQNEFFEKVGLPVKRISSAMLVGGGKISYFLAKILLDSGIAVKIIENKLERCEALSEMLPNATIIYGDGTDRDLLDEEGLATCEAFAALTGMDEENILLALHAGRHSRAKLFTKVNRVNFEEVIASMPIGKVIRPKQTTAELISQYTRAM